MGAGALRRHGGRHLSRLERRWDGVGLEVARWRAGAGADGLCRLPEHLVFVTLAGSLARTRAVIDGGERYDGPDFPGAVTFIPANRERRALHQDGVIDHVTIRIDPRRVQLPDYVGDPDTVEFVGFTDRADPFVRHLGRALTDEIRVADTTSRLLAESIVTTMMLHIVHRHSNRARRVPRRHPALTGPGLRQVVDYIDEYLSENIRLKRLADLAGMDVYQFARAFREATGTPPYQYVIERRVDRAVRLLLHTNLSIADIAHEVGLSSQSHLTTTFRKIMGTTPHAYRVANT